MMQNFYFEDLEDMGIGAKFHSPGRTVTEADIVNFAGLSGDFMPLHTDAEYAKNTIFKERIAHGMLGMIIASGLFTRTELAGGLQNTAIALLGINWGFKGPIKIGDTVHLEVEVAGLQKTKKEDRGIIALKRRLINQRNEVVHEGETPIMVRMRKT
jgi:acyl dehydratase